MVGGQSVCPASPQTSSQPPPRFLFLIRYRKEGDPPTGIPVRSSEGLIIWEPADKAVFQDGLADWMGGLPTFLHSRIFSLDNVYRANFTQLCDTNCLPQDKAQFAYMLDRVAQWHPFVYEQDWMNVLTASNPFMTNNTAAGCDILREGEGAGAGEGAGGVVCRTS